MDNNKVKKENKESLIIKKIHFICMRAITLLVD